MIPLSSPCSRRYRASGSAWPCVASTRLAPVSRNRVEQRGPVGVVREDEAAIVGALPADAAHAHQSGGERVRDVAQPPHPRRAARREGASTSSPANDVPRGLLDDRRASGSIGTPASR